MRHVWNKSNIKADDEVTVYTLGKINRFPILKVTNDGFYYKSFHFKTEQRFDDIDTTNYVKKNGDVYMGEKLKEFLENMEE